MFTLSAQNAIGPRIQGSSGRAQPPGWRHTVLHWTEFTSPYWTSTSPWRACNTGRCLLELRHSLPGVPCCMSRLPEKARILPVCWRANTTRSPETWIQGDTERGREIFIYLWARFTGSSESISAWMSTWGCAWQGDLALTKR